MEPAASALTTATINVFFLMHHPLLISRLPPALCAATCNLLQRIGPVRTAAEGIFCHDCV
jgi:hypothetical protein